VHLTSWSSLRSVEINSKAAERAPLDYLTGEERRGSGAPGHLNCKWKDLKEMLEKIKCMNERMGRSQDKTMELTRQSV